MLIQLTPRCLVVAFAALLLAGCQQDKRGEFSFSLPGGGVVTDSRNANAARAPGAGGSTRATHTRSGGAASGIMSYAAFTGQHGAAREVILSADGSHFISRHNGFPDQTEAEIRLWRVQENEAYLVAELPLPGAGKGYGLRTRAAISADGGMVALVSKRFDAAGQDGGVHEIGLYVAASNRHHLIPVGSFGISRSDGCSMAFLDADTLVVCLQNHSGASSIFLVGGLAGRNPAPVPYSTFQTNLTDLGHVLDINAAPDGKRVYAIAAKEKYNIFGLDFTDRKVVLAFRGFPANRLATTRKKNTPTEFLSDIISHVGVLPGGRLFIGSSGHFEIWRPGAPKPDSIIMVGELGLGLGLARVRGTTADGGFVFTHDGRLYQLGEAEVTTIAGNPGLDAVYNEATREILSVSSGKNTASISRLTVSPQRLQAAKAYAEGLAMVKAGFQQPGFEKIRQSATLDITYWFEGGLDANHLGTSVSTGVIKADLAEMGRTFLHAINLMDRMEKRGTVVNVSTVERDGKVVIHTYDRRCFANNPLLEAGGQDGDYIVSVNGQSFASRKEYLDIVGKLPGDTEVEIVVAAMDGSRSTTARVKTVAQATPNPIGYLTMNLAAYGMLAVQAGHPGIALQVESRLRRMVEKREMCRAGIAWANLLGGLARAANGNPEDGYNYILANGGLDAGGGALGVYYAKLYSRAAAPLYRDRTKMAFLMKDKPEELPNLDHIRLVPQPYPDLAGNLVQPSGETSSSASSTAAGSAPATPRAGPIMPAAERAQQGTAPAAGNRPSGAGVVLD